MTTVVSERWVCLGKNEDQDFCDCCGKSGLKETYRMGILDVESGDTREIGSFGCVCAGRHSGRTAAKIRAEAITADQLAAEVRNAKLLAAAEEIVKTMVQPSISESFDGSRFKFECGDAYQYVYSSNSADEERRQYGLREVARTWRTNRVRETMASLAQ